MDEIRTSEIAARIKKLDCFDAYNYVDNDMPSVSEWIKENPLDVIEWLIDKIEEMEAGY